MRTCQSGSFWWLYRQSTFGTLFCGHSERAVLGGIVLMHATLLTITHCSHLFDIGCSIVSLGDQSTITRQDHSVPLDLQSRAFPVQERWNFQVKDLHGWRTTYLAWFQCRRLVHQYCEFQKVGLCVTTLPDNRRTTLKVSSLHMDLLPNTLILSTQTRWHCAWKPMST